MNKITQLIKDATPLPWSDSVCSIDGVTRAGEHVEVIALRDAMHGENASADRQLIVIAVNMLPKLVEALEEIQKACPRYSDDEGSNAGLLRIMQVTNGVLAKANNPDGISE